jgi:hypothetical protein
MLPSVQRAQQEPEPTYLPIAQGFCQDFNYTAFSMHGIFGSIDKEKAVP